MMRKVLFQLLAISSLSVASFACATAKNNNTTSPAENTTIQNQVRSNDDVGNCPGPRWGDDSVAAVTQYTLYREFFRQDNLDAAIPHWRNLYAMAPQSTLHLYVDGPEIIDHLIRKAPNDAAKNAYVDTLMALYDKRIECFGRRGFVLSLKAIDLLTYRPTEIKKAYEWLNESIKLQGNEFSSNAIFPYMATSARMYQSKDINIEKLLQNYDRVREVIAKNITPENREAENYRAAQTATDDLISQFLTCTDLLPMQKARYEQAKGNAEDLKSMIALMDRARCTADPFYLQVAERLFELEPSADGAHALARAHQGKNNNRALEYYRSAIEMEKNNDRKAEMLMQQAQLHRDARDYNSARSSAQRAAQLRSGWGLPYLFIGDLYATTASSCGDNFNQQTVYWAAVDQYQRARSVDPSVSEDANRRIATYSPHFPTQQDLFFRDMSEGSNHLVGCWINENTTVRARR